MKKLTLWAFAASCAMLFAATPARAATIKVVATTQDLESLAREVGGDKVVVDSLARGYLEPLQVVPKACFIV